jgi:hypothetical protein
MISIILTLDYEIYGDGSGDVKQDMIIPTNRILKICDKYEAKLTLMFEVLEYLAFKREEKNDTLKLNYSPSKEIEKQARQIVKKGHDVQLHLHPQWINAKYYKNKWKLNLKTWRLPNLSDTNQDVNDISTISGVLFQGKKILDRMLIPNKKDYECLAFRSGAWCIQPEKKIIQAMKYAGLLVDSTVFKGGYINNDSYFDFRQAFHNYNYWWTELDDICKKGKKGENIAELPIYSQMKPFVYNLKFTKLKNIIMKNNNNYNRKSSNISNKNSDIMIILKNIFKTYPIKWNMNTMSYSELYSFLENVIIKEKNNPNEIPLIMIGHSKAFYNDENFEKFLKMVNEKIISKNLAKFQTLGEFIKKNIKGDLNN